MKENKYLYTLYKDLHRPATLYYFNKYDENEKVFSGYIWTIDEIANTINPCSEIIAVPLLEKVKQWKLLPVLKTINLSTARREAKIELWSYAENHKQELEQRQKELNQLKKDQVIIFNVLEKIAKAQFLECYNLGMNFQDCFDESFEFTRKTMSSLYRFDTKCDNQLDYLSIKFWEKFPMNTISFKKRNTLKRFVRGE